MQNVTAAPVTTTSHVNPFVETATTKIVKTEIEDQAAALALELSAAVNRQVDNGNSPACYAMILGTVVRLLIAEPEEKPIENAGRQLTQAIEQDQAFGTGSDYSFFIELVEHLRHIGFTK